MGINLQDYLVWVLRWNKFCRQLTLIFCTYGKKMVSLDWAYVIDHVQNPLSLLQNWSLNPFTVIKNEHCNWWVAFDKWMYHLEKINAMQVTRPGTVRGEVRNVLLIFIWSKNSLKNSVGFIFYWFRLVFFCFQTEIQSGVVLKFSV